MSDYKIISDSTSDLPIELVNELNLHIIPMIYTIDGKDYVNSVEGSELSSHDFYELLRSGKTSTTTQINIATFKDEFSPFLERGLDILYIGFSSGLSSTYNSALMAVNELKEEFPDRRIVVVDSLSASLGEGLLVYHAALKKKEGLSLDELAKWTEEAKFHIAHWFTVEDLNHLKRGGRLSGAAAFVGTMLHIKPVLFFDNEGHLLPVEKIRGRRNSLDCLVAHMVKSGVNDENQIVFISHGDALDGAEYVAKQIEEKLGCKTLCINHIGPIIGTHSGPGTVALFFYAKDRY